MTIELGHCNYLTKRKHGECWQLSTPFLFFFRIPKSCFFLGLSLFFFDVYIKIPTTKPKPTHYDREGGC